MTCIRVNVNRCTCPNMCMCMCMCVCVYRASNQHRDSVASHIGHYDMMSFFAVAQNDAIGRVRYQLLEVCSRHHYTAYVNSTPYFYRLSIIYSSPTHLCYWYCEYRKCCSLVGLPLRDRMTTKITILSIFSV
jgi:hypothetical protein